MDIWETLIEPESIVFYTDWSKTDAGVGSSVCGSQIEIYGL